MAKIKSFGARVYFNGVAVGGLTDISASGTDVSMIDSTSHDSAGGYRTFLSGLKDGGTLELTGRYNYADAGQAEWKAEIGVKHNFYVMLSDNSGLAFEAYVGGFSTSNPLDDAVEFSATAKITGIVVPVFPTITVTGTLTSNGSAPVTIATLSFDSSGLPTEMIWKNSGTNDRIQGTIADGGWTLIDGETSAEWVPPALHLTPFVATSWTAQGSATGTPTVTGS